MLDRIADFLWAEYGGVPGIPRPQHLDDALHQLVRGVLQLMREPTEGMLAAAPFYSDADRYETTLPEDSWRQMIDEALK